MQEFKTKNNVGEEITLVFKDPQNKENTEADRAHAVKVAELLQSDEKFLSKLQIDQFLRDKGIWTEEDENKVVELQEKIAENLDILRRGGIDVVEARTKAIETNKMRYQIAYIMQKRTVYDNATIENQAETERNYYLVYACTVTETGERYWKSFKAFKDDEDTTAFNDAVNMMAKSLNGEDSEFEKRLPEVRWLRKFNFIDENFNFTNRKTGEKVNEKYEALKEEDDQSVLRELQNLQGEIHEDAPFLDEETGEPVETKKEEDVSKDELIEVESEG